MIFFAEILCRDFAHDKVNAAYINDILSLKKNESAIFYSEKAHFQCVKKSLIEINPQIMNKITFNDAHVKSRRYDLTWWFFDGPKILRLFLLMKKHKAKELFFLSTNSGQLYWIRFFLFFFPTLKLNIVIHGILEEIKNKPNPKPWIYPFWFGFVFFKKDHPRIRYSIISPHIEPYMESFGKRNDLDYNHLPYHWSSQGTVEEPYNNDLLNLCTIGSMTAKKGRDNFKEIIHLSLEKNINFHLTSYGETGLNLNSPRLTLNEGRFDREVLDHMIKKIDFILMPIHKDAYHLMVSGVFYDAINYEKPILAMKCPFLEYYFNLLGNIGYLVDTPEELVSVMEDLAKNQNLDEYSKMIETLKKAKVIIKKERDLMYKKLLFPGVKD